MLTVVGTLIALALLVKKIFKVRATRAPCADLKDVCKPKAREREQYQ